MPRRKLAATNPPTSVTLPPPTARTRLSRVPLCSSIAVHSEVAVSSDLADSPSGTISRQLSPAADARRSIVSSCSAATGSEVTTNSFRPRSARAGPAAGRSLRDRRCSPGGAATRPPRAPRRQAPPEAAPLAHGSPSAGESTVAAQEGCLKKCHSPMTLDFEKYKDQQFCDNTACASSGKIGQGNIRTHSRKQQQVYCTACKQIWVITKGTFFYHLKSPVSLVLEVLWLLAEE